MKLFLSVLFVSIVAGSYAFRGGRTDFKKADTTTILKQKAIFELLQHPYQPGVSVYKQDLYNIVQAFDFEKSYSLFNNVDAVKEFYYLYKKGLMPYNELFSIYNMQHRRQAIALFHVFYYAKDWETFYKTLVWARYNVNPGLFVYSLHVAMVHRADLANLELPAIYEIFPHYFFSFDVIQRAQLIKQQGFAGVNKIDNVYNYVIAANYSNAYVHQYDSQEVSYFTEDIGLNAYHYYFNIDYPFWMGGSEYNMNTERRGEYFIFYYQQLLARYYMERLSNDLGVIEEFSWYKKSTGYYPNLRTYYGYPFETRENGYIHYEQGNYYNIDFINSYEERLLEGIDSGRFLLSNGTYYDISYPGSIEILGNILQGNPDSLNAKYYGYMYMVYKTFGNYFGVGQYFHGTVYPSVLSQPETQLRDPIFYAFLKKVLATFYFKYVSNMKPYTVKEIAYDGVHIESVTVDKMTTYFDKFDADISNAVDVEPPTEGHMSELTTIGRAHYYAGVDYVIKTRQPRLNHLPFEVKITVASTVQTPSVIRIYLGPKYDEYGHMINVNENRYNYFLLDAFKYDLTPGNNVITRESVKFFHHFVKDRSTFYELYQSMMTTTVAGTTEMKSDYVEAHNGFPSRLLLPKGKKGGQVYQLFVHIAPYHATETMPTNEYGLFGYGYPYVDSLPMYYPLDRPIDEWYTSNMFYQDVTIFHKTESEVNSP